MSDFLEFHDIFYPQNLPIRDGSRVFQHPRLFVSATARQIAPRGMTPT